MLSAVVLGSGMVLPANLNWSTTAPGGKLVAVTVTLVPGLPEVGLRAISGKYTLKVFVKVVFVNVVGGMTSKSTGVRNTTAPLVPTTSIR